MDCLQRTGFYASDQLPKCRERCQGGGKSRRPRAITPTYCATKAALHSFTQSLRYQLQGTGTEVLELIPPYVATDLMDGANDPRAMPLADFLKEVMAILETGASEICVENVKRLRFAAETGHYDQVFKGFNDAMSGRA